MRQVDSISPVEFIIYLEYVIRVLADMDGASIHGHQVNNLKYADNTDMSCIWNDL